MARSRRTPLRLHGARTKDFYGEALTDAQPLDLSCYRGIVDYEPSELVITARCGTPLSEIEATLAGSNQFLGFEPPRFGGDPTLGGIVASGLSGPRRMQVGAVRDFVLGARLLVADGEVLRFGGQVMKNVAGFDVSRLLCGSLGILGIITELSLKVLPRPRAEQSLRLQMSAREAVEAFNRWGGRPLPISAAAWFDGIAWVRLSGAEPAVRAACADIGGDPVDSALARQWWESVRDGEHSLFAADSIWRISLPSCAAPLALPGEPLIDWGGAVRWYAGDLRGADVRSIAAAAGGTALRWRGSALGSRFHPLPAALITLHQRLKAALDPEGIFNPGRLLLEL